jgi:hypothetical protein
MAHYIPASADVHSVRAILAFHHLPNELVLEILDRARYWVERDHAVEEHRVLMDEDFSLDFSAVYPYLGFGAFSPNRFGDNEIPKIREMELTIVSHGTITPKSVIVHLADIP